MSLPRPVIEDLRIHRQEPSRSGGRAWVAILIGLILLAAGGMAAWWFARPKPLQVNTAVVREINTKTSAERTVLNASGYVTARREATVSSKITGKVEQVLVEEGMKVREGQVLAHLDSTNVKASLALSEAQLSSSQVALEETRVRIKEAEREYQRESGLMTKKVTTQADFDRAEATALAFRAKLQQQNADVTVAQRQVESWRQQLEDTVIRAPFTGIVTSKNAQPGEMISPMSSGGFTRTGICTIVDMDSLEIEIDVNESYINRVHTGQPVEATLDAYPDLKIPCKVIAIIPTADRQKSTVKVRVGFDKLDTRILPEMSVKVSFRDVPANGDSTTSGPVVASKLIVPGTSVVQRDDRDVVFVVKNDKAERRAVNIAQRDASDVILTSGVSPGEKVVVNPPPTLQEGSPIK